MTEKIFMTYMNATVISYQGSASTKAIAGLPTRKRLVSFVPAGLVALMLSLEPARANTLAAVSTREIGFAPETALRGARPCRAFHLYPAKSGNS